MRIVLAIVGLAGAIVAVAASCTPLPALGTGCGNKVIDDGEDCDGFGDDASGARCIAAGQPSQCHYSCASSGCPAPFTCGAADHVCRRPAGTFGTSVAIAGEPARRVLTGDFDGDGAEDVVTIGATSRVHFFDGHTSTQQTLLSSDASFPTLGHVTTDGRTSGLVTSTYVINPNTQNQLFQGNVRVWRGSPDRTLLPTVYPNIDLTAQSVTGGHAISALRANEIGSDVFALLEIKGTTLLYYVAGTKQTALPVPVSAPLGAANKIHGRVPVGVLGTSICPLTPFTACEGIVLAFDGDKTVSVHSTCDKTLLDVNSVLAPAQFQAPLTFTLPNNDTVAGPAFLFAPPSSGAAPTLYVVGSKAVYAFPPDSTQCSLATTATTLPTVSPTPMPLALGFIDDVQYVDWVAADGIHVDNGFNVVTTAPPANTTWTDAVIGDLNINGLPDVVAVANGSIDFYNGTGSALLNGKHITLDGFATHMAIGDFDGDFVSDVAVSTHGDSTGLASDSIDIAFGTFTGFPSQPVSVGRLSNLQQLEPTFFDYRISGSPDLVNTIFALGTGDSGDLVVSILEGNPDRLINSPYFLFDPTSIQSSLVSTTVGDFTGSGHAGIAGVSATQSGPGLWYTPMTGEAQVDVAHSTITKAPSGVPIELEPARGFDRAGIAAIDVGGAAGQELLVVQPSVFFLTHVAASSSDPWPTLAYEQLQEIGPAPDKGIVLRVADVDGDGDDDAIVEYTDGNTNKFAAKIVLNGMNGALSFQNASPLSLPEGTVAVTTIHASKDGATQILALASSGVYLAQMSNGTLGPWSAPVIDLSKVSVTVHDAIAGDVDGDGVDDVVIATSNGFMVYFGDAGS